MKISFQYYYADDGLSHSGADKLYLRYREMLTKKQTESNNNQEQRLTPIIAASPASSLLRKRPLESRQSADPLSPYGRREPTGIPIKKMFVSLPPEIESPAQVEREFVKTETPKRTPKQTHNPTLTTRVEPRKAEPKKMNTIADKMASIATAVQLFKSNYLDSFVRMEVNRWVRDSHVFSIRFINHVKKMHPSIAKSYVDGFDLTKCRFPLSLYMLPFLLGDKSSGGGPPVTDDHNNFICVSGSQEAFLERCDDISQTPRLAIIGTLHKPELFLAYCNGEVFRCKTINNAFDIAMEQFISKRLAFPTDMAAAWQFMFIYFWNLGDHMEFCYKSVSDLITVLDPVMAAKMAKGMCGDG